MATGTLLLAACGSDDDASDPQTSELESVAEEEAATADSAPTVVATTSIWADVTANVTCDGLATVETIIPLGGDPHSFEPSLRDRETMDNAELVVANGLFLEESLADTIDAVESNGVTVLRVGDELDPLPAGDASHDEDHESDEDQEDHESDFRSRHDGAMHACGPDALVAMLASAARLLHELRVEVVAGQLEQAPFIQFSAGVRLDEGEQGILERAVLARGYGL